MAEIRFFIVVCCAMFAVVATATGTVTISIHLNPKSSETAIEQAFVARSTPESPLFRQHLSTAESLRELVGATPNTIDHVMSFLQASTQRNPAAVVNGPKMSRTHDMVAFELAAPIATKGTAEKQQRDLQSAFGIPNFWFDEQQPTFRKVAPMIPRSIIPFVSKVVVMGGKGKKPASKRGALSTTMKKAATKQGKLGFPGMTQTPQSICSRYNCPLSKAETSSGYSQGVGEFEASFFQQSDIRNFSLRYNLTVPDVEVTGPNQQSFDDIEGTLDLEYMTAVSGAIKTWWISQNSSSWNPGNIDFSWWADEVLAIQPQPPSVVSISWGMGMYRYALDPALFTADNNAFRKLGLYGISVFVASGDSGPGARSYLTCSEFMPSWPAASPYVTTVGATYIDSAEGVETAVSFSGGGFSYIDARPSWQQSQVEHYLTTTPKLPKSSFYNSTGRGYPDVAAFGTNFQILAPGGMGSATIVEGVPSQWQLVSGTSCASPTFAGIIARINAERLLANQTTLGFLNPKLYQLGKVGYDVVNGYNEDTDCFFVLPFGGFPTAVGWDPVTGLGTPDYNFLKNNL